MSINGQLIVCFMNFELSLLCACICVRVSACACEGSYWEQVGVRKRTVTWPGCRSGINSPLFVQSALFSPQSCRLLVWATQRVASTSAMAGMSYLNSPKCRGKQKQQALFLHETRSWPAGMLFEGQSFESLADLNCFLWSLASILFDLLFGLCDSSFF